MTLPNLVKYYRSNMEFTVLFLILLLCLLTLPLTFPLYAYKFLTITLMFIGMALSWNILGGYAGYLSFGHMSFFGIGAYTTAILVVTYGVSSFLSVPLGAVFAATVMLVALYVFIRLEEAYFAIATLALNFAMYYLALALPQTNGSEGIFLPLLPFSAIDFNKLFFATFALVAIGILLVSRLIRESRLGKELVAMRDDRLAAESLGINTLRAKLIAGVVSAGAIGLIGALYPLYLTYVDPSTSFGIEWSILLVVMVVFGGLGSLAGPVIGAFVFETIQQVFTYFAPFPQLSIILIGAALVILLLGLPKGVYGTLSKRYRSEKKSGDS